MLVFAPIYSIWNLTGESGGLLGSAFGFGPGDPGSALSLCVTLCFLGRSLGSDSDVKESSSPLTSLLYEKYCGSY